MRCMSDPRLESSQTLFESPRFTLAMERYATEQGPVERAIIHHPGAVVMVPQPDPEHVVDPAELPPALERALASGKPACVNVMTDPTTVSPGSIALANVGAYQ